MSFKERETDAQEPIQQFDEMLCESRFYNEAFTIRMKGSVKREEGVRERREIVDLRSAAQPRDYVFIKPYILLPDIQIGIDLFSTPSPTGAIGTVASTDWIGK